MACVLTGYTIIYFLHSYFLWLNAMALNTWMAFNPNCLLAKLSERMKAEFNTLTLLNMIIIVERLSQSLI